MCSLRHRWLAPYQRRIRRVSHQVSVPVLCECVRPEGSCEKRAELERLTDDLPAGCQKRWVEEDVVERTAMI